MKTLWSTFIGLCFGFVMSRVGFTSWDLVHGMFTFTDFQLLLTFIVSVGTLTVGWLVLDRLLPARPKIAPRGMHPGILVGGALFGAGWALSGGCPTIALAQIGEGQLAAVYTLGGIIAGNWIYGLVHERFFDWPVSSCLDD